MSEIPPTISPLLTTRTGEEMGLNEAPRPRPRGRIVRTLGYDRQWAHGEGSHLIDRDGNRYLDLLSGYGVFAIGRNHPDAMHNVADTTDYRAAQQMLREQLDRWLSATGDPRAKEGGAYKAFDQYPYYGGPATELAPNSRPAGPRSTDPRRNN